MTAGDDAAIVAREVQHLRSRPGALNHLRADLLEQAQPATAAAFLREQALLALGNIDQYDTWAVSAMLQLDVLRQQRRLGRR